MAFFNELTDPSVKTAQEYLFKCFLNCSLSYTNAGKPQAAYSYILLEAVPCGISPKCIAIPKWCSYVIF
jgi:hypothetical protein